MTVERRARRFSSAFLERVATRLMNASRLAGGTLVTARVSRSGLVWAKTEVWVVR